MMTRTAVLSLSVTILTLILFFSSCVQKQEISTNEIKFDTISVSKFHHLNNDSTLPSCNLKIRFIYPIEYKDGDVLSKLQKKFLTGILEEDYASMPVKEAIDKYTEDYVTNYLEDAKHYFDEKNLNYPEYREKYFSYYESLSNEIMFNKANLLSMQIVRSDKKSSNNSFRQYTNYVIDLSQGDILTENDIFNEGYDKVLSILFKEKLFAANKVKNTNDLEDLGYFGIDEIAPNNNFFVDEKGITYIFNKGEYSVLQSDEIKISIPYSEIMNILKEKSPISIFYTI